LPEDWKSLSRRFGLLGDKRRYTGSTYLSNRLDVYFIQPYSTLAPFTSVQRADSRTNGGELTKKERLSEAP
jgi:hypothetical protein